LNALDEQLWLRIEKYLNENVSTELKSANIGNVVQDYIKQRITGASEKMNEEGEKLITKKETIMVIGSGVSFENFFKKIA
jgi:hypothetical protein